MENKKENQTVSFENLKVLSQLVNSNEINHMITNIKKAKQSLEVYYKSIKDKVKVDNSKPQNVIEPSESVISKPQTKPTENVSRENSFVKRDNKPNYNNNTNKNFQQKVPFNKNNQQGNFNGRPNKDGQKPSFNKPFNKDGAKPNNNLTRPMAKKPSTSIMPEIVVQKNDRTFGNKNKTHKVLDENKNKSSIKTKIKMGIIQTEDFENEERMGRVRVKTNKKQKNVQEQVKTVIDKAVITTENLTVKILSEKIGKPAVEIIKKFMLLGMMLNINSVIDFSTAELVANELGVTLEQKVDKSIEEQVEEMFATDNEEDLVPRAPIVTVMGHVDHGKTSLLDAIKKTNVIAGEAGGITQHIGSYTVNVGKNKITFIDTPGHAAFTAMRARGAQVTDIAILVVAADDGIMPQTVEAINHIKAAGSVMIVAINKVDKPEANPERVKQQLTEYGILPEEWGGDTICVPISAKNNQNIDKLLEMVLLVSDMLELKANPNRNASAYVIESKVDKGRGIVTNVIVKNGTLKLGDNVVAGLSTGRVKAMVDYLGNSVKSAGPSMAVSIVGLNVAPDAGDMLYVVDEKMAKNLVEERTNKIKVQKTQDTNGVDLQDFLSHNIDEQVKVLKLIVKADVMGSVEAVTQTLEKIRNEEVKVEVIHKAVGGINESDVLLAQASNAIIIGFNVKTDAKSKKLAETNKVQIQQYRVIYEAVDYVTELITGMKAPKYEEKIAGHAEVRHLFKISSVGTIAGSYVLDGNIIRSNKVRVMRGGNTLFTGDIDSLKIMKDDVKQVKSGFECGIKIKGFNDLAEGDIIESFENVKIN